jgi:YHS domain-containing protein
MRSIIAALGTLAFLGCSPGQDEAQEPVQETQQESTAATSDASADAKYDFNLDERGLALRGYDAVSYFSEGQPVEGLPQHKITWRGVPWQFASAANRDKFARDPEKYAPSNGGYCTFGIVLRKKFDGDPQVWSIQNERLYIFLNETVRGKFFQDKEGNFEKVVGNWPYVKGKDAADL